MLSLSAILLCLGALEVSHGLLSPEELTATFHERYPYPDIRGNPCGIRAPYEELDWWQRMYPLKTRQRTMRDLGMPEVANLVVPASRGGLVRTLLLSFLVLPYSAGHRRAALVCVCLLIRASTTSGADQEALSLSVGRASEHTAG